MQKGKMADCEGLTNSCEKKRIAKQRRKVKIYPFKCRVQRIARRDKKAFLSNQCKEIEENNRMGKTRDHQIVNTENRLIILFANKDGEAL